MPAGAAGLPAGLADVNRAGGAALVAVAQALDTANGWFTMLTDADRFNGATGLQANQGFTLPQANLIMASFTDIHALYQVAHGHQQQVGNNDFFFNAKLLLGVTPIGT